MVSVKREKRASAKVMYSVIIAAMLLFGVGQPALADSPRKISLCEEEAELLVRSAAFAARGNMGIDGRGNTRTAASYAARVGIIATVLNRMSDPRFPESVSMIIASDRTFSRTASAVHLSEQELTLTRDALEAALDGFDPTNGALYFSTPTEQVNRFTVTCVFEDYSFGVPLM